MTLHDIDMRIRALTTILTVLDRQASSPTKGPSSIELTVAMHIATLLTCSFRPVTVATRMTADSMNIFAMIGEDPEDPGFSNAFVVGDPTTFSLTEVQSKDLDPVELEQLWSTSQLREDITLKQHITDVVSLFNTFRTVPPTESAEVRKDILEFIVQRCAPIISHRLRSDKFILKRPLDEILQGWEPSDADQFVVTEFKIPRHLPPLFKIAGIECRQSKEKYFAPWTREIAPVWMRIFLWLLSKCKDCIQLTNNKVSLDLENGVPSLVSLQKLVRTEGFKSLLELESVTAILDREVLDRPEDPGVPVDPQSWGPGDIDNDDSQLIIETEEDSVALTMRYLVDAVAWIAATEFLFSNQHVRRAPKLHLHLAITPCPADPTAMADAPKILVDSVDELLTRRGKSGNLSSRVRLWSKDFARNPQLREFAGTVHCEASLMAAIVKYSGQADIEGSTTQHIHIPAVSRSTPNKPRTIAVAKNCCWCCNTLAALLNSTDIQFNLPGCDGQIFSWALPGIGISEEVARSLEAKLQEQLEIATESHMGQLLEIPGSPASSDWSGDFVQSYWERVVVGFVDWFRSRRW